jgi:YD repeat-containing protein
LVLHDRHFCGKLSGIFDRAFLAEKDQVIEQPGAVPVESREKLHYDGLLAASSQPPSLRRPENLMKCRGCGVELDPSEEQVHSAVDRILGNSRQDAQKKGGVCPLCGRSKKVPYSHRRTVLLGLLLACLIVVALNMQRSRQTKAAVVPEYSNRLVAAPRFDGEFPCVFASVTDGGVRPQVGNCAMPTVHGTPIDRFEADLRYGNFVLRETDLFLDDGFKVPLTRTDCSHEWVDQNPMHAFGRNSNHPYDIAPIGTRFPYTYQMIVLEDADFLYFDRISKGTGYADAVFQHTETSTRFYKATTRRDGHGWITKLADGSEIRFPESYNAKNLAQGAPYEMRDASGNRLELQRDPRRNLAEIKTPHGHWIRFSYDDLSRIKRAEDDMAHWTNYDYTADGMLKSVV